MAYTAALLGLISAAGPLAIDLYLPAFPTIARDLHTAPSQVQLTLVVYFAALAVGQLVYGPLSDALGRKLPLQGGLALFAFTTLGCALAPNIETLLILRALQGLGACSGMIIARAVVRDLHTGPEAARLLSLMMLVWGVSPLFAPLIGSLILTFGSWRLTFALLLAVVAATFILATFVLKESHPPHRRTPVSVGQSLANYGRLLKDRRYMGLAVNTASWTGSTFTYLAMSSFVFTGDYHLSPSGYGVLFGVCASGQILSAQTNAWLMRRLGPERQIRYVSLFALAVAGAVCAAVLAGAAPLWVMILGSFALFSCQGVAVTPASVTALDPQGANAGAAAALMGSMQLATGAVISGLITTVFAPHALALVGAQLACMAVGAAACRIAFRVKPQP